MHSYPCEQLAISHHNIYIYIYLFILYAFDIMDVYFFPYILVKLDKK
jgi:hypothetical protein